MLTYPGRTLPRVAHIRHQSKKPFFDKQAYNRPSFELSLLQLPQTPRGAARLANTLILLALLSSAAVLYSSTASQSLDKDIHLTDRDAAKSCDDIGLVPYEQQCTFAREHCAPASGMGVNYFVFYYCTMAGHRIFGTLVLLVVMLYAFLMLGTAAGDYLCPNLSNISQWLHLSQSVAGVTLAALGNGAPDILSTFSAMTADTAGLAIGELLGAAMFVTFVVVGAIAIVNPFKLPRRPFIRDIVAFIGALILVLIICSDKKITQGEGWSLIAYYFAYVTVVVVGAFVYQRHKARKLARELVVVEDVDEDEDASEIDSLLSGASRRPFFETDALLDHVDDIHSHAQKPPLYDEDGFDSDFFLPQFKFPNKLPPRDYLRLPSGGKYSRSLTTPSPNFGGRSDSPRILMRRNTDSTPGISSTSLPAPTRDQLVRLGADSLAPVPAVTVGIDDEQSTDIAEAAFSHTLSPRAAVESSLSRAEFWEPLVNHLLPSYSRWRHLTVIERIQAAFQAPIYILFSLTVPAVHPEEMELYIRREQIRAERVVADSAEDIAYLDPDASLGSSADDSSDNQGSQESGEGEASFKSIDPTLTIVQLAMAPLFIALALDKLDSRVGSSSIPVWALCLVLSLINGVTMYYATRRHPIIKFGRLLAIVGFIISVMWVYVVASETVIVLTAMASVLGISNTVMPAKSDAVVVLIAQGLTLFAIGNSLGDLITNVSIAQMGYPAMAVGACFGSPMLNLVLGIGVTSTYLTSIRGTAYEISQSLTPVYACGASLIIGLTASLIYIPANGFRTTAAFDILYMAKLKHPILTRRPSRRLDGKNCQFSNSTGELFLHRQVLGAALMLITWFGGQAALLGAACIYSKIIQEDLTGQ
ncbi:Sodium/calcium exchanger protein-domain-containing protein [Powellomyces hirtus]|nr:Sodium/calcium exchanger protein-domain-containing protein [Powellomyces hirtus]